MEHQENLATRHTQRIKQPRLLESEDERKIRLKIDEQRALHQIRQEEAVARHQRFLEKVKVLTFMSGVLLITCLCLYVSFSGRFQQEEKKAAGSIIQSVVMGIVGYLAGKASNKADSG